MTMAEAPKTPEAGRATHAASDVRRNYRTGLRRRFGQGGHAVGTLTNPVTRRVQTWRDERQEKKSALIASKTTLKKARREALTRFGKGTGKAMVFLAPVFALGAFSFLLFGTSWGVPAALVASQYGLPIFGRMLGGQFAVEDLTSFSDWWDATIRHFRKDRIDFGRWLLDGEVVVKEKPQADSAAPQG